MKKHLINQFKEGERDTYSVYKNPDEQLRKEISSFKVDTTKFNSGWPDEEWVIVSIDETTKEVEAKSGRNVKFFSNDKIKEIFADKLLYERNQKYQPHNYFKDHFGIISYLGKHKDIICLSKWDIQSSASLLGFIPGANEEKADPTRVQMYGNQSEFEASANIGEDDAYNPKIELKVSNSLGTLNIYFNENGDYVNRDYNEDFNNYKTEDISPAIVMNFFIKSLKKLGADLLNYKDKYYTSKYCIIPYSDPKDGEYGVELHPLRDKTAKKTVYQRGPGEPIFILPKSTTKVPVQHLIDTVLGFIPEEVKKQFEEQMIETNQ